MAKRPPSGPEWMPTFLAALAETRIVLRAVEAAGVTGNAAYYQRRTRRDFADAWDAVLRPEPSPESAVPEPVPQETATRPSGWKTSFFEALAETSDVIASAARVNVPVRTINKLKRDDAAFAAKWLAALHEGYDHLEMELLGYLRNPAGRRKMDEQAVRESIDAFLEGLRQRRLANEAILTETEAPDEAG
jgi:hypothetical protein